MTTTFSTTTTNPHINALEAVRGDAAQPIEWALQQGQIKNVVLVGNSQAGRSESHASAPTSGRLGAG